MSERSWVIRLLLELKRRNAVLEEEMPLERYMSEDPFDNHPLFKSEEQARVEDTISGVESIEAAPTTLDWPTDDSFVVEAPAESDPDAESEESGLWSRSRDFDWGD